MFNLTIVVCQYPHKWFYVEIQGVDATPRRVVKISFFQYTIRSDPTPPLSAQITVKGGV